MKSPRRRRSPPWKRRLLVAYLGLLVLSHLWRALFVPEPEPREGQLVADLPELTRSGETTGETVRLAYRDTGPREAPVVVLLHGSPTLGKDFDRLRPLLPEDFRYLVPDLPGFGRSTPHVVDYSNRAHAHYLQALLDRLDIEEAHLVGYSMGGGVALAFHKIAPQRVASLTMFSSIGVQELELLGDYTLNHALHGFQLGALWFLHEGVPHFGLLDPVMLDVAYARNFFETDQRPYRTILEEIEVPVLILHGTGDVLVPTAAAREHARLLPQSDLVWFEGGHAQVLFDPAPLVPALEDFLRAAEAGTAPTRAEADPQRLSQARMPFAPSQFPLRPESLAVIFLLLVLATLVSEDLTCIGAGLLVAQGVIGFWTATLACFVGILAGDGLLYLLGYVWGQQGLRKAPLRWLIAAEDAEHARHWFEQRGILLVLISRFLPGSRVPVYVAGGLIRANPVKFLAAFIAASAVWTPLLVLLAWGLGGQVLEFFERYEGVAFAGLLVTIVVLLLALRFGTRALTHRGRRLLYGQWVRFTRWEYWPAWALYAPVFFDQLGRGLARGGKLYAAAANPAIPHAGLVGESKSAILDGFRDEARPWIASYAVFAAGLDTDSKMTGLEAFRQEHGLGWPVVLKPDAGQRGEGVAIVRDEAQARAYFEACPVDVLAQAYVAGVEYGLFYVRQPGEEHGRITSVTHKQFPCVKGDGRRRFEDLLLDHPRGVASAPFLLQLHADRLEDIPAEGETIPLVELGTHCRGSFFTDGRETAHTPALEKALDAVSRSHRGFFFGRFDVRAESLDALRTGRFHILEANGLTSEPTHLYDPHYGLFEAWAGLVHHWRLADRIGRAHVRAGRGAPLRASELWGLFRAHLRSRPFEAPSSGGAPPAVASTPPRG